MTNMSNRLMPIEGTAVKYGEKLGIIQSISESSGKILASVKWFNGDGSKVNLQDLTCGFQRNMEVRHKPLSYSQKSLGCGNVVSVRIIGNREQVLVDFPDKGQQIWLPYESLKFIKGPKLRFFRRDKGAEDAAERFRLKSLAHAIDTWNENSGALSKLDIDPLPHQIHLVHHILAHGNLNWMIADDVGLGKTIETGMLLKALSQRGMARRILLVTPAGLTQQWKEELQNKFGFGDFRIYGENFTIDEPREWGMYNHVIGSIDRFKDPEHLMKLMHAEPWDIIIFDEAHRLSRRQNGMSFDSSMRFKLAKSLRKKTDALILLSATPHQGKHDKFVSLLELLRPDLKKEIGTLKLNPELLKEMLYRNNKSDVTDAEGNFIFKGKVTKAITVEVDQAFSAFDSDLQSYLRKGYAQAKSLGSAGNAIGFVMTVYRKLAASSAKAINSALIRRKVRLEGELGQLFSIEGLSELDQRYIGELEENFDYSAKEFFDGEIALLDELIAKSEILLLNDKKINEFLNGIVNQVLNNNLEEKILIFTEYRSTQNYLFEALSKRFSHSKVELINGSMKHQDRREAIKRFEGNGQFLISTEAGGEGINLQKNCHIMVNYDLPWNPMRLVQRIGRLYRYGQKKRVIVFNIHSPGTADEQIIQLMYERIGEVVNDLSTVGDEFHERLSDDILGEIVDLVDVESILQEATLEGIYRTQQKIDEALEKAKSAANVQQELFDHASSFDPNDLRGGFIPSVEHLTSFVESMFNYLGIQVIDKTHSGKVWQIRVSEELQDSLGMRKSRWDLTLDRVIASNREHIDVLDLDHLLMKHMLEVAKSYSFQGQTASIQSVELVTGSLFCGFLRWQNNQGVRQRQEYMTWYVDSHGDLQVNDPRVLDMFKSEFSSSIYTNELEQNKFHFKCLDISIDDKLAAFSSKWMQPENYEVVSAAWLTSDKP
ncbi:DEAD/DEAH box helicase [Aliivibrio finisterrensis]|uniref:DEAD/DEAH box helicase n=1 Tax=Aliivibrio finisterrensis TaxID=511998 RepID=A0A4Q5KLG3_9GAMM|nr:MULTISPECIES: helicase-related protein [Aliivibrio]MDD9173356.1 helicase-related protein [Aliivibrio sp. S3TY1]MDD9190432.1 helicase-related protein [Aliivibrio sp. S2TY2]RYU47238.1 DEAD/DEAH box helicase [Aliivibrio finisterrensis]